MKISKELQNKQTEYADKYSEIIVHYYDGGNKSFTPYQWALFEKGVRKISKKIVFVPKE